MDSREIGERPEEPVLLNPVIQGYQEDALSAQ